MTTPLIPDTDTLGQPTNPYSWARSEWALLVDCDLQGAPGPHLLAVAGEGEAAAKIRLRWWQDSRPEVRARLVRRKIVETFGEWEEAR